MLNVVIFFCLTFCLLSNHNFSEVIVSSCLETWRRNFSQILWLLSELKWLSFRTLKLSLKRYFFPVKTQAKKKQAWHTCETCQKLIGIYLLWNVRRSLEINVKSIINVKNTKNLGDATAQCFSFLLKSRFAVFDLFTALRHDFNVFLANIWIFLFRFCQNKDILNRRKPNI